MKRFSQALFALAVIGFCAAGTMRTWKDKSGKYNLRAEMVKVENGKVHLKREMDGQTIRLELQKLSRYDQIWVNKELKRQKEGDKPPEETPDEPQPGSDSPTGASSTDWPQWRGPNRDGKSAETGLLSSWPAAGPRKVWSASGLGRGYAGVAVVGDRIYTMGRLANGENIICLDAAGGRVLWQTPMGDGEKSNCTPTVDGDRVYGIAFSGDLACVSASNGQVVWRKNFKRDYGGRMMSQWGFAESPLIDGDKLVCTPGADQLMMVALKKTTGQPIWATKMPQVSGRGKDGAGYSSVVISNAAGIKQYVQLVGRGLIGVNASTGKLLWGYNKIANDTANIPTPVAFSEYIFCSTGYQTGAALLKLVRSGSGVKAVEGYFLPHSELQVHHGGMIYHNGHIYCGHGHNEGFPKCIDVRTGKNTWQATRGPGRNSAAVTYADGHIYFRYQDGTMALVEANPAEYRLKGTFRIATVNAESWPHPVISDGKLYLRDQDNLHCYDIRE